MNDFEKTPILQETLIETLIDKIQPEDQTGSDSLAKDKSEWLLRQYTNATVDSKQAMDIVVLCLTGNTLRGIIEMNETKNKTNQNVG